MKIVSQLDDNGYFVCTTQADNSPLEPGIFLMPRGCIDYAPPTNPQFGKCYKYSQSGWQEEDIVIEQPQAVPDLSETEQKLLEIDMKLNQIDQQSIRPARVVSAAIATDSKVPTEEIEMLSRLEKSAQNLRKERELFIQNTQKELV